MSKQSNVPAKPLPRGKRTKAKKRASKYAEQDEEDRELAMRLLGSKAGQDAAAAEAEAKKAKEQEAIAQKQRRREQHLHAQALGLAAEEARRTAHEAEATGAIEETAADDESTKLELAGLDAFIGRPLPGDELLEAIPVCAPWSALANYKYKVKLQPGSTKKGKAVKEILGRWDAAFKNPKTIDNTSQDPDFIWPREIGLIKGWKEAEIYGVVHVGKVRVMMAGGGGGGGGGAKGKKSRGGRGSKR